MDSVVDSGKASQNQPIDDSYAMPYATDFEPLLGPPSEVDTDDAYDDTLMREISLSALDESGMHTISQSLVLRRYLCVVDIGAITDDINDISDDTVGQDDFSDDDGMLRYTIQYGRLRS